MVKNKKQRMTTATSTKIGALHSAAPVAARGRAPLVAHILYRLDIGGLENGLVNLINAIPAERYRHAVISLTEYTDFRFRIRRQDVEYYALHKRPGKDPGAYVQLWRLLRRLQPQIVHTRNLPALDCLIPAALAGVRCRVHGEHGRDMLELDGKNWKYNLLRRALRPLVQRYIPLSHDLENWLQHRIGVTPDKISRIYNGVDTQLFHPAPVREPLPHAAFALPGTVVVGTVGRMQAVKDQLTLVRAFLRLLKSEPSARNILRLVLVGDGPLRHQAAAMLAAEDANELAWLAGTRDDVPRLLRGLDVFVLPSLAEGISNTILEAMACGLPVVATRVGGNPELVIEGKTGMLVPAADPVALADALANYLRNPGLAKQHGAAGRERVVREFSLNAMVQRYVSVYDEVLVHEQRSKNITQ